MDEPRVAPPPSGGFALVEVSVALAILAVATAILAQTYRSGHALRAQAMEEGLATAAAQTALERMRGTTFREIVPNFDADPYNDPLGPGTAHGATFDVAGLEPTSDDDDGRVGQIFLPVENVGTEVAPDYQVREDIGEAALGIPRDLSGDSLVDSEDHTETAILLPVLVRIRWAGRQGDRQLDFYSAFTEFEE